MTSELSIDKHRQPTVSANERFRGAACEADMTDGRPGKGGSIGLRLPQSRPRQPPASAVPATL